VPGETDGSILDTGTLYVAKFNDDGTGEWLALAPGRNGLTPANGFADLADILVNTRLAADFVGATKMDRPEWGTVDPNTGEVYFALTNNSRRTQAQVDAVNPRAENNFGQIVRWNYANADHTRALRVGPVRDRRRAPTTRPCSTAARWRRQHLRLPGRALVRCQTRGSGSRPTWATSGPTTKGPLKDFGMNAMLAADPATGEIRRFLTGPWGQE
jgi:uncharacterized protein